MEKSVSSSTASSDLPEEIVSNILERLPVIDLLRYKTVCKSWPSIISNPQFIKSHLLRALISAQKTPLLLTLEKQPLRQNIDRFLALNIVRFQTFLEVGRENQRFQGSDQRNDTEARLTVKHLDHSAAPVRFAHFVRPQIFTGCRVVSSYNGVICLADINDIYLWNPSIKKYKRLPVPKQHRSLRYRPILGFGFDSISMDYKVVKFLVTNDGPLVQLYSANADSWREFLAPTLTSLKPYSLRNVVVNGVIYFDGGVSFDLHEEVFRLVLSPGFATERLWQVFDYEGSVAAIFECTGDEEGVYLCTLDTVSGTWTKKFNVDADITHLFYVGAEQFYGRKLDDYKYLSSLYTTLYDYEKKEANYYEPPAPVENICGVLKYTESLVSINGFQQVE